MYTYFPIVDYCLCSLAFVFLLYNLFGRYTLTSFEGGELSAVFSIALGPLGKGSLGLLAATTTVSPSRVAFFPRREIVYT